MLQEHVKVPLQSSLQKSDESLVFCLWESMESGPITYNVIAIGRSLNLIKQNMLTVYLFNLFFLLQI